MAVALDPRRQFSAALAAVRMLSTEPGRRFTRHELFPATPPGSFERHWQRGFLLRLDKEDLIAREGKLRNMVYVGIDNPERWHELLSNTTELARLIFSESTVDALFGLEASSREEREERQDENDENDAAKTGASSAGGVEELLVAQLGRIGDVLVHLSARIDKIETLKGEQDRGSSSPASPVLSSLQSAVIDAQVAVDALNVRFDAFVQTEQARLGGLDRIEALVGLTREAISKDLVESDGHLIRTIGSLSLAIDRMDSRVVFLEKQVVDERKVSKAFQKKMLEMVELFEESQDRQLDLQESQTETMRSFRDVLVVIADEMGLVKDSSRPKRHPGSSIAYGIPLVYTQAVQAADAVNGASDKSDKKSEP